SARIFGQERPPREAPSLPFAPPARCGQGAGLGSPGSARRIVMTSRSLHRFRLPALAVLLLAGRVQAQTPAAAAAPDVPFPDYDPPSTLKVAEHPRTRAKYPFIDIHNHQPDMPTQDLAPLVKAMDALNMAVMNNLSGRGFRDLKDASGKVVGYGV